MSIVSLCQVRTSASNNWHNSWNRQPLKGVPTGQRFLGTWKNPRTLAALGSLTVNKIEGGHSGLHVQVNMYTIVNK